MELLNSLEIVKRTLQKRKALRILALCLVCIAPNPVLANSLNCSLHELPIMQVGYLSCLLLVSLLLGILLMILLWREKHFTRRLRQDNQILLTRITTLQRQSAQLERVNRLKSEFFADMSHELRTPLNAVLGITETLSEQIYGALNESQANSLTRIYRNGEKLLYLISDIVDLSKLEIGRVNLKYEQFNLYNFCMTCLAYVKEKAHKKNIQIIIEPEQDTGLGTIVADPRRLKQILFNLLSNAVKFSPEGSTIGLRVTLIAGHDEQYPTYVRLSVWDQGLGISAEQQAHIFEPFTEQYHQLEVKYKGTGLGLALVKQLTELHHGEVQLSSELGQGSCFTVTLPNPLNPTAATEPPTAKTHSLQSTTTKQQPLILLVEDTQDHVDNVRDFLTHFGYQVSVAYSGQEALTIITHTRPSLVLMDINMSHMDGFEVTQHIRDNPNYQDLPIIAVTAMTMSGDKERCLAVGMNDYVSKPLNLRKLLETIEKHLQKKTS